MAGWSFLKHKHELDTRQWCGGLVNKARTGVVTCRVLVLTRSKCGKGNRRVCLHHMICEHLSSHLHAGSTHQCVCTGSEAQRINHIRELYF